MALITVTAETVKKEEGKPDVKLGPASVNYDFGDSAADAVAKHTPEVVFSNYRANAVITIQSWIRSKLKAGKAQAEITALFAGYKIGVASAKGIDVEAAFMAKWSTMSDEDKKKKLLELKAS
uniref:Uncharacterized protein n=1 Tax=viral metagenome TaxID=1070528 RepID=A0A6M3J900_9ZZZZ